jgi:flagellar hook-basal body complex protein FliE|tara:strand:+ start:8306 stop:8674 length:369 start_codon:yes stop_codon:yes gene_type:complete
MLDRYRELMMINPINSSNIESVLGQIRQYQAQAAEGASAQISDLNKVSGSNNFSDSVKGALQDVNATQQASKALRTAYERGEDVPLTDVVMSIQKSSLAFEATLQIRNKVLKAYEEIMNMPV